MRDNAKLINKVFLVMPEFFHKLSRPAEQTLRVQINPTQFWILARIIFKGNMTMTDISQNMGISKQQVTQTIDKMIEHGYVVRIADEQDRRRVKVSVTSRGIEVMEKGKEELKDRFGEKIAKLNNDDFEALGASMDVINRILRKI